MRIIKKFKDSGRIKQDSADVQRAAFWARVQQMLDSSRFVKIGTQPITYESAKVKGLPWEWVDQLINAENLYNPFAPIGQYSDRSNYVEIDPLVKEFDFSKAKGKASDQKKHEVSQGINYILDYYNSPGFAWRMGNARYLSPEHFSITNFNGLENKAPLNFILDYYTEQDNPNASYRGSIDDEHTISVGSDDLFKSFKGNWQQVGAHEATHAVDEAIRASIEQLANSGYNWSEVFPIFERENKINKLGLLNADDLTEEQYNIYQHDRFPGESYADLGSFREALYRLGIYDSREITPFTKEHLEAFKKTGEYSRLLEYFDDDAIIWMMNNIAMNDVPQEQLLYLG